MDGIMNSTDFFERQAHALRATQRLVFWFSLSIAGTTLAIYFVFRIAMNFLSYGSLTENYLRSGGDIEALFRQTNLLNSSGPVYWDPLLLAIIAIATLLLIGGASLIKALGLSGSTGADIARQLGGREINPRTNALDERRLINVVQEMSLASGVPVPQIFILEDENSINAFAAGTRTDCAAIAVSRGALDKLSRDELQAVVGHEFSHILNGDMKLNIRLIGWIFGLVVVSLLGQILFRLAVSSSYSRSRSEKGNYAVPVFLFIGIALVLIGTVSQVFAQIIQASISRHRERLADASATQFTRNPTALANALARIGGDSYGSRLNSPYASEFAHLFFANGVNAIFATHPPLEERILALNPDWDGKFLPPLNSRNTREKPRSDSEITEKITNLRNLSPVFDQVSVPVFIDELSRTSGDAKALIYLLMMTDSPEHNVKQAKILHADESASVFKKMESLWSRMKNFPKEKRISGVLLAAPALRELSARERRKFCDNLDRIARADGDISLYEFCILNAVKGMLIFSGNHELTAQKVQREAELVLNLFLRESGCPVNARRKVLSDALSKQSAFPSTLQILDDTALTVPALENAFRKLRDSEILVKKNLLNVARTIILADGQTTESESDLIRSFSVALNCPLPE